MTSRIEIKRKNCFIPKELMLASNVCNRKIKKSNACIRQDFTHVFLEKTTTWA